MHVHTHIHTLHARMYARTHAHTLHIYYTLHCITMHLFPLMGAAHRHGIVIPTVMINEREKFSNPIPSRAVINNNK